MPPRYTSFVMDAELKQYLDGFSEQFLQMREENAAAHEETRRVLRGDMGEMTGTLRGEMGGMTTTLRGEMTEQIGQAVSTLRGEIAAENAETRRHFDQRMAEENAGTRRYVDERTSEENAETRRYVDERMSAEHAETRRHFDITVERWETRFDLLAESVQMVDQKLDRNVAEIREEIVTIKFTRPPRTRRAKR